MICVFSVCTFFLNCTATTEIYTYRHTRSLHAALPISFATGRMRVAVSDRREPRGNIARLALAQALAGANSAVIYATGAIIGAALAPDKALSSEEHTSELQSLMRISYAGFCL